MRVTSVLHALRQMLPRQNAEALSISLPDFLKGYFASNWLKDEKPVRIEHLDELVTLVMERDKKNEKRIFMSEIQTLSAILLTLKNLFKMIPYTVAGISHPFYQELSEAASEIS